MSMPGDHGPADGSGRPGDVVSGGPPLKLPVLTVLEMALSKWWGRLLGVFSRVKAPKSSDDGHEPAQP
jgi:hypothetical protein